MNSRTRTAVLISVIVLLVVGAVVGALLHKSNEQAAMTQPGKLSQLTMIDTKTGWALTRDDQIFRTVDGGDTWTDVSIFQAPTSGQTVPGAYQNLKPAQDFYADADQPVFFGEQKKDGMLMLDYVQNGNHVMQSYNTTDAGDTWTLGPVSNNPDVTTYSFIDAATGWGTDRSGRLFATIDGRATWTAVTTMAK